ncbi:MAG: hypothetical protein ACOX1U_08190 [Saccharofermentanales bacterium]|jgi:hypothetical protein|nr:hypothetical protein [Clostridiaceae bacterium]
MSPFEIGMLVCFGISWPISVFKSWKTKSTAGKSILFMTAILIGYISGILHKIFFSPDFVILIYIFNLIMVSLDVALYWVHYRRERMAFKDGIAEQTPNVPQKETKL